MSAAGRGATRRAFDVYPTPAWCVRRLLERVEFPGGRWLDPCAGDGAVIRAAMQARTDIAWYANEIREECSSALQEIPGLALTIGNYLDLAPAEPPFDVILTNPPYFLAEQFVAHALINARHVAMLLRLNYLGSARRASFFHTTPPDVYVLPNRPSFVGTRTDASEYAWLVWGSERNRVHGSLTVLGVTPREERATHAA